MLIKKFCGKGGGKSRIMVYSLKKEKAMFYATKNAYMFCYKKLLLEVVTDVRRKSFVITKPFIQGNAEL
jgi:hypothetical protein